MNLLFECVTSILRGVVKVALVALAALFLLGVLCVGVLIALAAVIRFLLTGRKPTVVTTFARFNQAARQFRPGGSWARAGRVDSAGTVDVEAHEVHPAPIPLPPRAID